MDYNYLDNRCNHRYKGVLQTRILLTLSLLAFASALPWFVYKTFVSIDFAEPNEYSETIRLPEPLTQTPSVPDVPETPSVHPAKGPSERVVSGHIKNSLASTIHDAGLPARYTLKLAKLFQGQINFAKQLRPNDSFSLVFESDITPGGKEIFGELLGVRLVNRGTPYEAILFKDERGQKHYYNAQGHSLSSSFLRYPVKFTRISSPFSKGRKHPILGIRKPHLGVDLAAPHGTPIKASRGGRVIFKGRKGGYGNAIILKHDSTYTTLYAHMSSFAKRLRKGQDVKQGQIIGFVGSTGYATGAHLHYEIRVHGQHVDPMKVQLPRAHPLSTTQLAKFKKRSSQILARLHDATVTG